MKNIRLEGVVAERTAVVVKQKEELEIKHTLCKPDPDGPSSFTEGAFR